MASICNGNCLQVATLIAEVLFKQLLILLYNRLNIAGNEVSSFQMMIGALF